MAQLAADKIPVILMHMQGPGHHAEKSSNTTMSQKKLSNISLKKPKSPKNQDIQRTDIYRSRHRLWQDNRP
jgi:hypothetical protein